MNLLLDTQSFVWFIEGNPRLTSGARAAIENTSNNRWLNLASVWEYGVTRVW